LTYFSISIKINNIIPLNPKKNPLNPKEEKLKKIPKLSINFTKSSKINYPKLPRNSSNIMDTSSEFESSEIEEDKTFDTLTPSPENPHPLSTDHSKYLPPLEKLPLPKGLKIKLKSIFSNDSIPKIHSLLFWQVFYKKLKPETTEVLQDQTSKKLAKNYVKLLLSLMNQPAGKAIDLLPVLFGHSIHHEYFELFSQSRHHFDQRFILDCYKIIYLELSGLTVTDSFIETSAKKVLGNYYLEYLKTQKKKPQNNSGLASKKLEKQMNGVEGGIEFAKELALRLRPLITRKPERKQAEEEEVKLEISDTIIADRVHRHLSEKVLKKSFITDSSKIFNCNKLSPLLSRQINSSTVT
jgi:hypothetical protein